MNKQITVTLTENSHPHAEIQINAIANPELVVLVRNIEGEWMTMMSPSWSAKEYFLCHPKHEKECLHWLNGGDVQEYSDAMGMGSLGWHDVGYPMEWSPCHGFMDPVIKTRIKQEPEYVKVNDVSEIFNHFDEIYFKSSTEEYFKVKNNTFKSVVADMKK